MSGLRRAGERPRVTILLVMLGAVALVGAGLIGAALAGGDGASATEDELAQELDAERARSFELESQLSAALRQIEELQRQAERQAERATERRKAARSRSSSGSQGQSPSRENQP